MEIEWVVAKTKTKKKKARKQEEARKKKQEARWHKEAKKQRSKMAQMVYFIVAVMWTYNHKGHYSTKTHILTVIVSLGSHCKIGTLL